MADAKKTTKAASKATKATEVKTVAQLHEALATLRQEQLESRKSHRQGDLVNPHVLTAQRKAIARTLTALKAASQKEEN